jgi:ABC-type transport system substrate-binding protein
MVAPTSIIDLRRAIALSIDREALISATRRVAAESANIAPATSLLDPKLPGFEDGAPFIYPYDPQQAQQLASSIGWSNPLTITVAGQFAKTREAQITEDILARGIQATTKLQVTYRAMEAREAAPHIAAGSLPIVLAAWMSGFPRGTTPNSISIAQSAFAQLPEIRKLVDSGNAAETQKALLQQALVVPLYFMTIQRSH